MPIAVWAWISMCNCDPFSCPPCLALGPIIGVGPVQLSLCMARGIRHMPACNMVYGVDGLTG